MITWNGIVGLCGVLILVGRFDKDDSTQNQKLDEMDLDEILNRAEDHETMAGGDGTSLGGEGFLAQFAAVSDVKADMNWEDIIPLEERQRFEREEEDRRMHELAEQSLWYGRLCTGAPTTVCKSRNDHRLTRCSSCCFGYYPLRPPLVLFQAER